MESTDCNLNIKYEAPCTDGAVNDAIVKTIAVQLGLKSSVLR